MLDITTLMTLHNVHILHDFLGIDTSLPEHRKYVENLCRDFELEMQKMIKKGIEVRQKEEINDDLYFEVVQHVNFGRAKSTQFSGRESMLQVRVSFIIVVHLICKMVFLFWYELKACHFCLCCNAKL